MSELPKELLSRLKYELNLFDKDPPPGIQAWTVDDRVDHLEATIIGPEQTPFHKGIFYLDIIMPMRYPFEPPKVRFITPIYHPNVDSHGRICLNILNMPPKGGWAPALNLSTVLSSIRLLMSEPNPLDPLVREITDVFLNNHQQYILTATQWTEKHATPDQAKRSLPNDQLDTPTDINTTTTTTTTTTMTDKPSKNKRERDQEDESDDEESDRHSVKKQTTTHQTSSRVEETQQPHDDDDVNNDGNEDNNNDGWD
ncbi:hypothetical protein SAMD00019534_118840 [Acytostelium subglobosum LB1]|uniref:hypothetical protein n=1 Tax=Acytostelium subglobosum LB1 TaxID=1410327 RepID=UPI00064511CA|nr:hypothetical protein SAMD00019534_118840 [Acytostelium subglobosum LB1]GAM28708.1 hypothetical protein SAMD00019534_118840 [Acytostelium subglobosum LB1]|eukprot:XP_012748263.1 hypothetical protein SAMD00019534_118840 [Acytostelium subglobosum LB1]